MMTKKLLLFTATLLMVQQLNAQEIVRRELKLPKEILGLQVLKCDFHLHTVFSDGAVWPTTRVMEALSEGLDAISITEHVEYRPHMDRTLGENKLSRNIAYTEALKEAKALGIMLIPGVEITKDVPPGHFNALFIKDADAFGKYVGKENPNDPLLIRQSLKEARAQGAFIHWNHPWYKIKGNVSVWSPIIDSLYREKLIDGIEVINATKYDPVILGWVQQKNLTNLGNTDYHAPSYLKNGEFRTMTLVFVKDKSMEAIKQALFERQTVSYCNNHLYGDKKYLEEIFQQAVTVKTASDGAQNGILILQNNSSIEYKITIIPESGLQFKTYTGGLTLPGLGDTAVKITNPAGFAGKSSHTVRIRVENLEVAPDTPLETTLRLNF